MITGGVKGQDAEEGAIEVFRGQATALEGPPHLVIHPILVIVMVKAQGLHLGEGPGGNDWVGIGLA